MSYVAPFDINISKYNVWRRFLGLNSPPLFLESEKRHLWVSPSFQIVPHTDFISIFPSLDLWFLAFLFPLTHLSYSAGLFAQCPPTPTLRCHPHVFSSLLSENNSEEGCRRRTILIVAVQRSLLHVSRCRFRSKQSRRPVCCAQLDACSNYMRLISMVTGGLACGDWPVWLWPAIDTPTRPPAVDSQWRGYIITLRACGSRLSNERQMHSSKQTGSEVEEEKKKRGADLSTFS